MKIEQLGKEKITVSFSRAVGKPGLDRIKRYVELIEQKGVPKRKISRSIVNELSKKINKSASDNLMKKRGLKN